MTKTCPRCDRLLGTDDFAVRSRHEDGSVRTWASYCRDCTRTLSRERAAARYETSRDEVLAKQRERRARILSDPEKRDRYQESARMDRAIYRRRQGAKVRNFNKHPVDREQSMLLPIGPFRAWLLEQLESRTPGILCEALGISDRALWRWLNEAARAPLDMIDACFCRAHEPYLLRELYPDLYEFGDDEQVAA